MKRSEPAGVAAYSHEWHEKNRVFLRAYQGERYSFWQAEPAQAGGNRWQYKLYYDPQMKGGRAENAGLSPWTVGELEKRYKAGKKPKYEAGALISREEYMDGKAKNPPTGVRVVTSRRATGLRPTPRASYTTDRMIDVETTYWKDRKSAREYAKKASDGDPYHIHIVTGDRKAGTGSELYFMGAKRMGETGPKGNPSNTFNTKYVSQYPASKDRHKSYLNIPGAQTPPHKDFTDYGGSDDDDWNKTDLGGKYKGGVTRHKGRLSSPKLPAQKARNNGPGSGWHGESRRHSIAARKGHRRR